MGRGVAPVRLSRHHREHGGRSQSPQEFARCRSRGGAEKHGLRALGSVAAGFVGLLCPQPGLFSSAPPPSTFTEHVFSPSNETLRGCRAYPRQEHLPGSVRPTRRPVFLRYRVFCHARAGDDLHLLGIEFSRLLERQLVAQRIDLGLCRQLHAEQRRHDPPVKRGHGAGRGRHDARRQ